MSDHIKQFHLPLIDLQHMQAAFPAAKIQANHLSVPLHVLAVNEQPSSAIAMARQLKVLSEELNGIVFEQVKNLMEAINCQAQPWG